ncbi:hypothetical protein BTVI_51121 [Pitangus sulphuratus]|nr:hypothetical protein BTVI_51121 [Pitangus sulphuratus]
MGKGCLGILAMHPSSPGVGEELNYGLRIHRVSVQPTYTDVDTKCPELAAITINSEGGLTLFWYFTVSEHGFADNSCSKFP